MKENVLDLLMYLFQHYMDTEMEEEPDRDTLQIELEQAGFSNHEITRAFDWLDGLVDENFSDRQPGKTSVRVFAPAEIEKLDLDCRGFLLYLEHTGILSPTVRELVIDRVMALNEDEIDLERMKWVILMVLFNQPDQDVAFEWIENMVFDGVVENLH
jgi:Smg protein